MKSLLIAMFIASPAFAVENKPAPQAIAVPMEISVGSFEEDASGVWDKVRQLIGESRVKRYGREITKAIAKHDPVTAQKALDEMMKNHPEIKTKEPHAIEYHQGNINFWKKDFEGAYKEYSTIVKALELAYPNGVPPGGKYSEINAYFMSDAYFGRAASLLQLKKYPEAVADLDKAIAVTPHKRAALYVNKCRALFKMKEYGAAAESLDLAYIVTPVVVDSAQDKKYICEIFVQKGVQSKACAQK